MATENKDAPDEKATALAELERAKQRFNDTMAQALERLLADLNRKEGKSNAPGHG